MGDKEGVFAAAFRFLSVSGSSKPAEPALPGSVRHRDAPAGGGSSAPTAGAPAVSPTSPAASRAAAAASVEPDASPAAATTAAAAGARRTPSPPSAAAADDGAITAASAAQPSPPPASPSPPAVDPITLPHIRGTVRAGGRAWLADGTNAGPSRLAKFARLLDVRAVDGDALRRLAWSGVPACYRKAVWQMLLGHLPLARERQPGSLSKRKAEYRNTMGLYFGGGGGGGGGGGAGSGAGGGGAGLLGGLAKSEAEQTLLRQVLVDVPRTNPEVPLLHTEWVQRSLERVLYTWAMRHPASGYVQGINDLATPFYAVFLSPWVDLDFSGDVAGLVDADTLAELEADVYWCLTRLLDGIQDHYTPGQPGIQRMTVRLRELVNRIDEELVAHLEGQGVQFYQFAFRWGNCLLMREMPLPLIVRLWDSCIAEKDGFDAFYVYVCAALLLKFSAQLKGFKFQDLVQFLQKLPTRAWAVPDVEELLSQAFVYKTLFEAAPSHLANS